MGARGIIGFGVEPDEAAVLVRFDGLIQRIDQILDHHLAEGDLGVSTVHALQTIDQAGARGVRQCVLAGALQLPAATLSRMVESLVKTGLITRASHPTDRRVTMLSLTPAGRQRLARRREDYNTLAEALGPQAAATVKTVMPLLEELALALAAAGRREAA
jgi:DNA-binding MarR family transcriptional regulator